MSDRQSHIARRAANNLRLSEERTAASAAQARPKDRAELAQVHQHYAAILEQLRTLQTQQAQPSTPHAAWQAALDANRATHQAELELLEARHAELLDRYRTRLAGLAAIHQRQAQVAMSDGNPRLAGAADTARQSILNAERALDLELARAQHP